jgi:hypothetical protein
MVDTIMGNSPHSRTDKDTITAALENEAEIGHDPWNVCRGHDMVAVLSIGLRDIFGDYNCRNIRAGELSGALRLAYDRSSFLTAKLFTETSEWCSGMNMKLWA